MQRIWLAICFLMTYNVYQSAGVTVCQQRLTQLIRNGICYHSYKNPQAWGQASVTCASIGEELARITDSDTYDALTTYLRTIENTYFAYWTGMRTRTNPDRLQERTPGWTDIDPSYDVDWADNEPSGNERAELRVYQSEMNSGNGFGSRSGNTPQAFICQAIGECEDRSPPNFGSMSCATFVAGTTCSFSCTTAGYYLSGPSSTYCDIDLEWTNKEIPTCLPIMCPDPMFTNGDPGCGQGLDREYGSTCVPVCYSGFEQSAFVTLECTGDNSEIGVWSDDWPTCTLIVCPVPDFNTDFGDPGCATGYNVGSECTPFCYEGYDLSEEKIIVCTGSGVWSDTFPTCIPVYCGNLEPWDDENGDVSCTGGTYEDTCTYTCHSGYILDGTAKVTCLATGFWSADDQSCRVFQCPMPDFESDYGIQTCDKDNRYESVCTTVCNEGYQPDGWRQVHCRYDEFWSGPLPTTCQSVACDISELEFFDGEIICNTGPPYLPPTPCYFKCPAGEEIIYPGVKVVTCNGGEWVPGGGLPGDRFDIPVCEVVMCPQLEFDAGTVVCLPAGSINIGTVCSFECEEGHVPSPPGQQRTCLVNKQWNGITPDSCEPVNCGPYGQIYYGMPECNRETYKGVCKAVCIDGYEPLYDEPSECQANGEWSEPRLKCVKKACEPFFWDDQPGTRTCYPPNEYYYGTVCRFECDYGYDLQGEPEITCNEDGVWYPMPPTCKDVICPVLTLEDGYVVCPTGRDYGSVCSFACNSPYKLFGADKAKCGLRGMWSVDTPKCKLYDPKCEDATPPKTCVNDCDENIDCDDDDHVCCPSDCGYTCKKVKDDPKKPGFKIDPKLLLLLLAGRRPAPRPVPRPIPVPVPRPVPIVPACPSCIANACTISRCQTYLNARCGTTCNGCVAHFFSPSSIINGQFYLRNRITTCQCPHGVPPNPNCGAWMCNGVRCANNPQAECRVYGCGQQCYLQFFDRFGRRVPCRQQATCQPGINSIGHCVPGCMRASCGANPSAHCRVPLGGGQPQFYDQRTNQAIHCY